MAIYDVTTGLALTLPIKYDMEVLKGRYAESVMLNRFLNKSQLVKENGKYVTIAIEPDYSVGTVTSATGAFTFSATVPTSVDVYLDTWGYVANAVTDMAVAQSFWDPTKIITAGSAAKAFAAAYDTAIAATFSGGTLTSVGTADSPVNFDKTTAQLALKRLANANIPMNKKEDLSFILPYEAFYGQWLNQSEVTSANTAGLSKSLLTAGFSGYTIFGVPVYLSTVCASAGANAKVGILAHKEFCAIAMQIENQIEQVNLAVTGVLGKGAVMQSLYGVDTVRANHGVPLYITAS